MVYMKILVIFASNCTACATTSYSFISMIFDKFCNDACFQAFQYNLWDLDYTFSFPTMF